MVAARTISLRGKAAETWQIASTAHLLCLHEECLFEDALLACVETELGAVESVLVAKGAFYALLVVVNFARWRYNKVFRDNQQTLLKQLQNRRRY